MSFEVIQGHMVSREQYLKWDRWDQDHLHAFCGFNLNDQWVETQDLGRQEHWVAEDGLCLECVDHPDYVLMVLAEVP